MFLCWAILKDHLCAIQTRLSSCLTTWPNWRAQNNHFWVVLAVVVVVVLVGCFCCPLFDTCIQRPIGMWSQQDISNTTATLIVRIRHVCTRPSPSNSLFVDLMIESDMTANPNQNRLNPFLVLWVSLAQYCLCSNIQTVEDFVLHRQTPSTSHTLIVVMLRFVSNTGVLPVIDCSNGALQETDHWLSMPRVTNRCINLNFTHQSIESTNWQSQVQSLSQQTIQSWSISTTTLQAQV